MAQNNEILYTAEYIKDVLYFAVTKQGRALQNTENTHYFSIDNELVYENYYADFGPLNLGCVYKYCNLLNEKLKQLLNRQIIVHYTSIDPKKKANAAFLLGCFGVLYLSLPPRDALRPLTIHGLTFRPFQDATQGDSIYTISILDCLQAIKKARDLGFFNFQDFDYDEYDKLDKIQGGDLNWIVPGKFLAFIGPVDHSVSLFHPPEMYIDYFLSNNVKMVIRLNRRLYDGNVFRDVGIAHLDLFFPDGSCPPKHILFKFLQVSEDIAGAIAVHCKAGLGRTGSLIGCYLIKHYQMTALEAIGWLRICRPGSVIGHQQGWLQQLEAWLMKQGDIYRKRFHQDPESILVHRFGVYSIAEKIMQKQRIVVASRRKSPSPSPPFSVQKIVSSEKKPTVRPQASKTREGRNQTAEKKLSVTKNSNTAQIQSKGDTSSFTKNKSSGHVRRPSGSYGGGESKAPRSPSSTRSGSTKTSNTNTTNDSATNTAKINDTNNKNPSGFHQMPAFHVSHSPIIRNMNDAKNFLMSSNIYGDDKRKLLNPSITVREVIQYSKRPSYCNQSTSANVAQISQQHSTPGPATRNSMQNRRRLGRSPSPSPTRLRVPSATCRGTNTPPILPPTSTVKPPATSRNVVKEKIPDLLCKPCPRNPSAYGTASLGARRVSPAPPLSPSVRSDEQPLATQGDMLNSIKLQRRLRETLKIDGIKCNNHKDNNIPSGHKDKSNQRNNMNATRSNIQPKYSHQETPSSPKSPQHRLPNISSNKSHIPRSMSPSRRHTFY